MSDTTETQTGGSLPSEETDPNAMPGGESFQEAAKGMGFGRDIGSSFAGSAAPAPPADEAGSEAAPSGDKGGESPDTDTEPTFTSEDVGLARDYLKETVGVPEDILGSVEDQRAVEWASEALSASGSETAETAETETDPAQAILDKIQQATQASQASEAPTDPADPADPATQPATGGGRLDFDQLERSLVEPLGGENQAKAVAGVGRALEKAFAGRVQDIATVTDQLSALLEHQMVTSNRQRLTAAYPAVKDANVWQKVNQTAAGLMRTGAYGMDPNNPGDASPIDRAFDDAAVLVFRGQKSAKTQTAASKLAKLRSRGQVTPTTRPKETPKLDHGSVTNRIAALITEGRTDEARRLRAQYESQRAATV